MWTEVPCRDMWALLAAAYTALRDHFHVPDATLRAYLDKVIPLVGFPPPDEYLKVCGWFVERGPRAGQYRAFRCEPGHLELPLEPISIFNIVNYCRLSSPNYAIKRPDSSWPFTRTGESTMAITNQPIDLNVIYQSHVDPLNWTGPQNPDRAFTWEHIYGVDDGSVPDDEFIYVPYSDELDVQENILFN